MKEWKDLSPKMQTQIIRELRLYASVLANKRQAWGALTPEQEEMEQAHLAAAKFLEDNRS